MFDFYKIQLWYDTQLEVIEFRQNVSTFKKTHCCLAQTFFFLSAFDPADITQKGETTME